MSEEQEELKELNDQLKIAREKRDEALYWEEDFASQAASYIEEIETLEITIKELEERL